MAKEIPKALRIIWIISSIVCITFSFFYIVILEYYTTWSNYPYLDPIRGRAVGITIALIGIFSIIAVRKNEWESIKLFFEFVIVWIIGVASLNILALFFLPLGAATGGVLLIIGLFIGFLIPFVYFYFKLR